MVDPLPMLARRIDGFKKVGKTIALANGGFDLFHVGHARYLKAAAALADILVVAVNSDTSLRSLKGPERPILPLQERMAILCSLESVDFVYAFDGPTVADILLALKPHFHCKGSDYSIDTVPEKDVVRSFGGRIVIVGGDKVQSTSWLVKRADKPRHW
ncbi:MAG: adenylyltransferase/cytidyltransferase family protein [Candidatus Aminicenantes bacterium]|nr:adenylyltransferase/cytidyltransferase family protein [Candidatus Aminicenantes bacterium]